MFGGGGGLNPRKMQQMMKQMGIDFDELDVDSVTIDLADGETLLFDDAEVTKMEAQGQLTYQVVGEPNVVESGDGDAAGGPGGDAEASTDESADAGAIPAEDVELVAGRTGASEDAAREALEAVDGDLAAAVERLE